MKLCTMGMQARVNRGAITTAQAQSQDGITQRRVVIVRLA